MRPFLLQFRALVKRLSSERKVSIRDYARHIARDRSTLNRILRGEIPLPESEWQLWAAPFGLDDRLTEEFRQNMVLAAMSQPAQEIVWSLYDQVEAYERQYRQLGSSAAVLRGALDLIVHQAGIPGTRLAGRIDIGVFRRIPIDLGVLADDDDGSDANL